MKHLIMLSNIHQMVVYKFYLKHYSIVYMFHNKCSSYYGLQVATAKFILSPAEENQTYLTLSLFHQFSTSSSSSSYGSTAKYGSWPPPFWGFVTITFL
jgi:hypothetical protein